MPSDTHQQTAEGVVLSTADALDGGDVLPGFRLPVADIFADTPQPQQEA